MRFIIFSGFFFLLINVPRANAQQSLEISRIEDTITMDGMPNELAWQNLEPLPFSSYFPEAGKKPTESSDVRIGYTDDYLYLGARLYDSDPSKIQDPTKKRDGGDTSSDALGICLDTLNNNENGYCFFTHPSGSRDDLAISNDARGNDSINPNWNTFWYVETEKNGEGWFAEMRIPFSSLRYKIQGDSVIMGMIVVRWIARKNESARYPAIPNYWGFMGHFKPSKSQKVIFPKLENKKPLYISPYILGGIGQQQLLNSDGTAYNRDDDIVFDVGGDIKLGITSNLTLDLTLNTDFAQVEADNQQVNLTRYSLFFPEKRKFFQERASLFDFNFGENNRLFYSRQIGINNGEEVRILGGSRLTGSIGDWDLGVINMQTAREQNVPSENFGVVRLRRQVLNNYSYAGSMITSRIGADGSYNYGLGMDGVIRLFGDSYLLANAAQTFQDEQDNLLLAPDGMRLRLQLERRNIEGFGYDLEYSRAGAAYNPGIGFELRDDFTKWGNRLFYGWFAGEQSPVQNYQFSLYGWGYQRNIDSSIETIGIGPMLETVFKSGAVVGVGPGFYYQDLRQDFKIFENIIIPRGSYSYFPVVDGYFNTPSSELLSIGTTYSLGRFYDGYRWSGDVSPVWSVNHNIKLNGFYQINHLNFPERDNSFTSHIGRMRMEYYFSTELSISTFIQYSNAAKRISSNFRLRYNPREGNDLYVVYNEGLNTARAATIGNPRLPLSNNRTILLKYSYTFNW